MVISEKKTLQDIFLTALCEEKILVSVYLINGIQLQGIIDTLTRWLSC
jgi:RNA chaperone Hfq